MWIRSTAVALFLDEERLYTDCRAIRQGGRVTLPMLGWDRLEPLEISLPLDHLGKTLTIAQSTGLGKSRSRKWNLRSTLRRCG